MTFFQSSTPVPVFVLIIFLVQTFCIIKWNQALRYLWGTVTLVNTPKIMCKLWTLHGWYLKFVLISKRNCLMLRLTKDGVLLNAPSPFCLKCIGVFCFLETLWDFVTQNNSQIDSTCLLLMASSTLRPKGCVPVKRGGQGRQLYPGSVFSHLCTPLKTKQASGTSLHWNKSLR